MNQQTKDQIAREAAQQAIIVENSFKGKNVDYGIIVSQVGGFEAGYIAGAETWAERGEVLKVALEKLQSEVRDLLNSRSQIAYNIGEIEMLINEALSNYNNHR